jgi:NAD(P)-dependent dehydrogenase (short-subunit alcohol dehydrogenase family)
MTDRLAGKNVLVTGASSGIGQATALLLAASGCKVWGTSRKPEKVDKGLKEKIRFLKLDLANDLSVKTAVRQFIKESGGSPDIVINNAGYGIVGSIEDTGLEQVKALFDANVFGILRVLGEIVPVMRKRGQGTICNISSLAGLLPVPFYGHYCATKHAIEALTESLKQELRPFGVKVFCIEPGDIDTAFNDAAVKTDFAKSAYKKWITAFWNANVEIFKKAPGPKVIAERIVAVLRKKNPYTRYPAGDAAARLFPFLLRLVKRRLREKFIRMYYKVDFKK